MKRLSFSTLTWRLAIIAVIFAIGGIASAPPVLGSGPTMAVTTFTNGAGAPAGTVSAMSSALYQSVDQTGKFTAVGGGPLAVKPALDGSVTGPAVAAAARSGAEEVVIGELVSASGGSVVYRLSAYRTAPLAFVRTQIFSQSSLAGNSLTAGFVTNLNTLHAPRTAIGTIYSIDNGIHADLGSVNGFQLGQQFNVMRNGQKMAQAQITGLEADSATVQISNAVNGYKPAVGDALVGLQPLPPLTPVHHGGNSFSIWGLIAATGAALFAIGAHNQAGMAGQGPQPSPSSIGGFSVTCGTQIGQGTASQTFTFIFNQQVNSAAINFTTTQFAFFTTSVSSSQEPLTALAGPQPPTFDSTNTILTVTGNNLVPGQTISFNFTSAIMSTFGIALTPNTCNYTLSRYHHPAAKVRPPIHNPVPGAGGNGLH